LLLDLGLEIYYQSHYYSIQHGTERPPTGNCTVRVECVSPLSRSQVLTVFDNTWHRRLEPQTKEPLRWGSKSNKRFPYFYPKLGLT